MNRIAGRAGITLLLVLALLAGLVFFLFEYVVTAGDWVIFSGSPHVYNGGNIGCGAVTDRDGTMLLDLNASRLHAPEKRNDTVVLGTIGYAPPEQFGISQSDATADVYALGVLLNVLLTGCHPSERLARGRAGKLVLKCTQIDPKHRFPSVEKLLQAL